MTQLTRESGDLQKEPAVPLRFHRPKGYSATMFQLFNLTCRERSAVKKPRTANRAKMLASHLRVDDHQLRGVVPAWASFLTFTSQVGKVGDELVFFWMVTAWGGICRGAVVDWGVSQSCKSFLHKWMSAEYPLDDEHVSVRDQPACIDSERYASEVYAICDLMRNCYPATSELAEMISGIYWPGYRSPFQVQAKEVSSTYDLLHINAHVTHEWRVALSERRISIEMPGFVSLPADVCETWREHEGFIEHLTAGSLVRGKWRGEEFGDTLRYARAVAECFTGNGKRWGQLPLLLNQSKRWTIAPVL